MIDDSTLIAEFRSVGNGGRLTVGLSGAEFTFHVGGLTRSLTISDVEAVALAQIILARSSESRAAAAPASGNQATARRQVCREA
jgi:hypothetical protein